jgi:hypothetical protein
VVPPTVDSASRGNVAKEVPAVLLAGKSSRADVLLTLGEPDGRGPGDAWFTYATTRTWMIGGVFLGMGSAAAMGGGQSETRLLIKFDEAGLVAEARVDSRTCPQGGLMITGGNQNSDLDVGTKDCLDPAGGDLNSGSQQDQAQTQRDFARLVPDAVDERVERVFANTVWYGQVASSYARAKKLMNQEIPSSNLIVSDKSLVLSNGTIPDPGAGTALPSPVHLAYREIASVEVVNFVLNRWVAVRTNDGKTYYFAVLSYETPGAVDRIQTQAAGDLIRSKLQTIAH